MAGNAGNLVVSLGLNSAQYTAGLTKAERDAQQFAQRVRTSIAEVTKFVAGLAIGDQILEATKAIISEASALGTLADATGSSVESLSKLNNQAKLAGANLATMEDALLKLSAGMADASVKGTKTGQALQLLGVNAKDPAQALQEVVVALDKYADGAKKVALINALFGRSNAEFVATLKDMVQTQDVQATVTQKQVEEAQKLERALRELSIASTKFQEVVLNNVVPAISAMIFEFTEGIRVAGGLLNAFRLFGTLDLSDPQNEINELIGNIARLEQAKGTGILSDFLNSTTQAQIDRARLRIEFLQSVLRHREGAGALPVLRPEAPSLPGVPKEMRERQSEADKYLESLQRQLEGTQDLTVAEKVLLDISLGRIKDITQAQKDQALATAQQIDAERAAIKAKQESRRVDEEIAKTIVQQIESEQKQAQQVRDGNDAIKEQIAMLTGGEAAVRAITNAKLADTIAQKENLLAVLEAAKANQAQIDAIKENIAALKERQQLLKKSDVAKQLAEEAKALQDVKDMLSDTFANAFTDFITGAKSAKDAFKSFTDDLTRQIARIAAQNIANAVFGGKSGGSDLLGLFAKLATTWIGGAPAGGLPASSSGGGFGEHFAMGGITRGGWAMVGEHGPEIAKFPAGTRITASHNVTGRGGGGVTINQTINVPVAANSATLRHEAKRAFALAAAQMRRG